LGRARLDERAAVRGRDGFVQRRENAFLAAARVALSRER
jgi:hypothetical protein